MLGTKDKTNRKAHEDSAQFACEAAAAIRTVASLTREESCLKKYSENLDQPLRHSIRTSIWTNALFAFAQSTTFYVVGLLFWFGSKEIVAGALPIRSFFVVIFVSISLKSHRLIAAHLLIECRIRRFGSGSNLAIRTRHLVSWQRREGCQQSAVVSAGYR